MFNKGETVKLIGYKKSYKALVTGDGDDDECFAAVIIESDYDTDPLFYDSLSVGSYDTDFKIDEFELIQGE